jgi:hypothetical protein
MEMETLYNVIRYLKRIDQKYVILHHMGEPLLHARFEEVLKSLAFAGIKTEFSTNGLLLKQHLPTLKKYPPAILRIAYDYFGYHAVTQIKTTYKRALNDVFAELENTGIDVYVHTMQQNVSFVDSVRFPFIHAHKKVIDNWAGQVYGESELPRGECYFKTKNYVVVLQNGDIVPCCMDAHGRHVLGNINSKSTRNIELLPTYALCDTCVGMQFAEGSYFYRYESESERSKNEDLVRE